MPVQLQGFTLDDLQSPSALYNRHPISRAWLSSLRLGLMPALQHSFHVFFGPCPSWNALIFTHHRDPRSTCQQELMGKKASVRVLIRQETGQKNETLQSSTRWARAGTSQDFLPDKVVVDGCAVRHRAHNPCRWGHWQAFPHCWLIYPSGVQISNSAGEENEIPAKRHTEMTAGIYEMKSTSYYQREKWTADSCPIEGKDKCFEGVERPMQRTTTSLQY